MDRLEWERNTVRKMVDLYCRHHHEERKPGHAKQNRALCPSCRELLEYADYRIGRCRYGAEKRPCSQCTTHCFQPSMREQIRQVMRYAGPRMLLYHPLTALIYLWRKRNRRGGFNR